MIVLGDLVKLRAMEPSDAEALWRWDQDPDVMRWMDAGYALPLAWVRKWLEDRPRNGYSDTLFGIETLADATLIGMVRLRDAKPETGCAELDIYLGRDAVLGTRIWYRRGTYGLPIRLREDAPPQDHADRGHREPRSSPSLPEGRIRRRRPTAPSLPARR